MEVLIGMYIIIILIKQGKYSGFPYYSYGTRQFRRVKKSFACRCTHKESSAPATSKAGHAKSGTSYAETYGNFTA